jgi:hypothetical protein
LKYFTSTVSDLPTKIWGSHSRFDEFDSRPVC